MGLRAPTRGYFSQIRAQEPNGKAGMETKVASLRACRSHADPSVSCMGPDHPYLTVALKTPPCCPLTPCGIERLLSLSEPQFAHLGGKEQYQLRGAYGFGPGTLTQDTASPATPVTLLVATGVMGCSP